MPEAALSKAFALADLDKIAAELIIESKGSKIWLVVGDLGAGKTTLIKSICCALGVRSTMTSPTFSIVNEYEAASGKKIYHFDFYRLQEESEAFDIGVEEYLDSGSYCFIEWPDRIPTLIPAMHFKVRIYTVDPLRRTLEFQLHD